MNERRIAFIICVNNELYYEECCWYLNQLLIPDGTILLGIAEEQYPVIGRINSDEMIHWLKSNHVSAIEVMLETLNNVLNRVGVLKKLKKAYTASNDQISIKIIELGISIADKEVFTSSEEINKRRKEAEYWFNKNISPLYK